MAAGGAAALLAPPVAAPRRHPVRARWSEVPIGPRPDSADLAGLAERLYGWNCMPCHGPEGKGDGPVAERLGLRPRDLTRGAFKLKTSEGGDPPFDEDLYRTITVGILPGGMPAFPQFDVVDRWALVEHVKRLALGPAGGDEAPHAKAVLPDRPARIDAVRGRELFRTVVQCAACHGPGGRGDGPASAGLVDPEGRPVGIPDLSRGQVTFKAGDRAEDIVRVLTVGMPGSPMPAFPALRGQDLWDLAAFVESLYEEIPEGERLWLTAGCQSCHTVGKGRRVGPDLAGVARRRSGDWLRRWLTDPPRMLQDPQLRAEFRDYPIPMPKPDLSERETELLVEFLSSLPPAR